jgi:hypothetical protein
MVFDHSPQQVPFPPSCWSFLSFRQSGVKNKRNVEDEGRVKMKQSGRTAKAAKRTQIFNSPTIPLPPRCHRHHFRLVCFFLPIIPLTGGALSGALGLPFFSAVLAEVRTIVVPGMSLICQPGSRKERKGKEGKRKGVVLTHHWSKMTRFKTN